MRSWVSEAKGLVLPLSQEGREFRIPTLKISYELPMQDGKGTEIAIGMPVLLDEQERHSLLHYSAKNQSRAAYPGIKSPLTPPV